jgi:hypothetical protein
MLIVNVGVLVFVVVEILVVVVVVVLPKLELLEGEFVLTVTPPP